MSDIPKAGEALTMSDIEMIVEAIKIRGKNFPDEPDDVTIALIMMNIGDRFTPVTCLEQEWTGYKKDIPKIQRHPQGTNDVPKCPNGHVLTQGVGLRIGWIAGE